MPRIDDKTKLKRTFRKKPYRPWNLLEEDFEVITAEKNPSLKVTEKESNSNQTVTNLEPNSNQLVVINDNQVTNKEPISNRKSNRISNRKSNHTEAKKVVFYESQLDAKECVRRVFGLQRKILFALVEDCVFRNKLTTNPTTIASLKILTNADTATVKTAVQRLINKRFIRREKGKKGIGGFAIFSINEQIRNAVLEEQKSFVNSNQLVTNWEPQKEPISTISSSSDYINTTTTSGSKNFFEKKFFEKNNDWDNVDIAPLETIGFTKIHLRQIILDDKISPEIAQDSINFFAFDLAHNNKAQSLKTGPLNYFMGILRSGKPYAPPANYESEQDRQLRIYLEQKKEIERKRNELREELFQQSFNDWHVNLTDEEKLAIFPSHVKNSKFSAERTAFLRVHFKENIWPEIEKKLLASLGKTSEVI